MKAHYDKNSDLVTVTLSERNLLALLAQLRDPNRPAPALTRQGLASDNEPTIVVQSQADEDHYGDRIDPPGIMRTGTTGLMVVIDGELD